MLDNLSELISMIVSVLVVIVPFYLYILFRKAVSRRRTPRKKREHAAAAKPEPLPADAEVVSAPVSMQVQPAAYDRTPPTRKESIRKPPERDRQPVLKTENEETVDPFERFERYPPPQRAIIYAELLGKPKAFRD
jgi:cell division protein FtsN